MEETKFTSKVESLGTLFRNTKRRQFFSFSCEHAIVTLAETHHQQSSLPATSTTTTTAVLLEKGDVGVDETAQHGDVDADEVDHAEDVVAADVHANVGDEDVLERKKERSEQKKDK